MISWQRLIPRQNKLLTFDRSKFSLLQIRLSLSRTLTRGSEGVHNIRRVPNFTTPIWSPLEYKIFTVKPVLRAHHIKSTQTALSHKRGFQYFLEDEPLFSVCQAWLAWVSALKSFFCKNIISIFLLHEKEHSVLRIDYVFNFLNLLRGLLR